MIRRNKRAWQLILTIALMVLLATGAYAVTATNVVPATKAGDGSGPVSGYTISNVVYTLDNTSPQNIASWQFDLDAAASTVQSKLVSASGAYTACVHGAGFHWTCTLSTTVASANQLRVIAVQ